MSTFELDGITLEVPDALLNANLRDKLDKGDYERQEARAAKLRVQPGDRVLELGGGVGYISAICAQATDPSNILTVEANPALLDVIRANLDANGGAGAQVLHGAVVGEQNATDDGLILFRLGAAFWASSIADENANPARLVEVSAIPLAQLLAAHAPTVVIMDIEGAEEHLFDTPWPPFVRNVMMELHPRKYSGTAIKRIVDCMSASGLTYDPGCSRGALLAFRRVSG